MALINGEQVLINSIKTLKNLEVGGTSTLTGTVSVGSSVTLTSSTVTATIHSVVSSAYGLLTKSTDDGLMIAIGSNAGSGNRHLILTDTAHSATDHDHDTQSADPTIFLHSVRSPAESNTEWLSQAHDGSNAVNSVGFGGHTFTTAAQKARGTMTVGGIPVADETFVLDAQTITFKADGSGNVDQCTIAGSAAAQVTNIVATLAECTNNADFTAWDGAGDTVVYEWGTAGVAGNAIVFTEAATNITVDGAGTLGTTHAAVDAATLMTVAESGAVTAVGGYITGSHFECTTATNYALRLKNAGSDYGGITVVADDGIHYFTTGTDAKDNHNHIFVTGAERTSNYGHNPVSTNPSVIIHSATAAGTATDEWVGRAHDTTNATYTTGKGVHEFDAAIRGATSLWYHHHEISAFSAAVGGSGATFVPGDGSTLGGYQLNADTEYLYTDSDVHSNWDAASDIFVDVTFDIRAADPGGGGNTVDLKLLCYIKGTGDVVTKTQTIENAVDIDSAAQWTQYTERFIIDYDAGGGNQVDAGDKISIRLNLETDTSEVDDVTINKFDFLYKTAKVAEEV